MLLGLEQGKGGHAKAREEREKRGDDPRALLEKAAEIRGKLVKAAYGNLKRKLLSQCDVEQRTALTLAVMRRSKIAQRRGVWLGRGLCVCVSGS